MPEDLSLFGDDDAAESATPVVARPDPVTNWQVELLRKALDARGLASMTDRRKVIEEAVGRPVESLRVLSSEEALSVLSLLGASRAAGAKSSTWDDRDEDTWIDRL